MRKNTLIVSVLMIVTFLAMFLLSANTHVTEANPPQDVWEAIPAKPPGNSRERIEIHPYPGITVIYNPTDDDLNLPEAIRQLPICPEVESSAQPTPAPSAEQLAEPASCRARIGGMAKIDPNHPQFRGFPPGRSSVPLLPNSSAGQVPESQLNWRWSTNEMDCPAGGCTQSTDGLTDIWGAITTQVPSLDAGESWNNYHFYNRIHVAHPWYSSPCSGFPFETISTGIAYGTVNGIQFDNQAILERVTSGVACNNITSWLANTESPPGALMFRLRWDSSISKWRSEIWRGWGWETVDSAPASWTQSPRNSAGQEIWAANSNNFGKIHNPEVSFIHRIDVDSPLMSWRPWFNGILPSQLQGRSTAIADSPFRVMDLLGGDYTAISSHLP
jgi:hypothetical protein